LTWFAILKLSKRGVFQYFQGGKWKKFNRWGGHLNCFYGGVAGGAAVMSALVYKLNKVDRRITEANNNDQKAGKKSEWG
jgi:hypothetical protein